MSEFSEIPIVEIREAGPVVKDDVDRHHPWGVLVEYELLDGTVLEGWVRYRLKREVAEYASSLPRRPANMAAVFHRGAFWGTSTAHSLGG